MSAGLHIIQTRRQQLVLHVVLRVSYAVLQEQVDVHCAIPMLSCLGLRRIPVSVRQAIIRIRQWSAAGLVILLVLPALEELPLVAKPANSTLFFQPLVLVVAYAVSASTQTLLLPRVLPAILPVKPVVLQDLTDVHSVSQMLSCFLRRLHRVFAASGIFRVRQWLAVQDVTLHVPSALQD